MTDLKSMTDDDLRDMQDAARDELRRRKREKKLPVFVVDGDAYKSLTEALQELEKDVQRALNYKNGPEAFLCSDLLEDEHSRRKTLFGMGIEFWSESEYHSRPDKVFMVG